MKRHTIYLVRYLHYPRMRRVTKVVHVMANTLWDACQKAKKQVQTPQHPHWDVSMGWADWPEVKAC